MSADQLKPKLPSDRKSSQRILKGVLATRIVKKLATAKQMDSEKILVKWLVVFLALSSMLMPRLERKTGSKIIIPKVVACGVLYVLISTIAYDTFMYYDLFKSGNMGKFGVFWDLIGEIVDSHYKITLLYFTFGVVLASSVFYYVNSEVECEHLGYYVLLLPGCFLEYTGLLRQGLAAAAMLFSVGLVFQGRYVISSILALISVMAHSSVVVVYILILLAVLLASKVKMSIKAVAAVGILMTVPIADYALRESGGESLQFALQGYYENYVVDKTIFGDFGTRLAVMWIALSALGLFSKSKSRKIVFAKVLCGLIMVLYPWFVSISGLAVRVLWYMTPFAVPAIHDGLGVLTNRKVANRLLGLGCIAAFSYYVYLAGQSEFVNPIKESN